MISWGFISHIFFYFSPRASYVLLVFNCLWFTGCRQTTDYTLPLNISAYKGEPPVQAWQQTDSLYQPNGKFNPGISAQSWWLKTKVVNTSPKAEDYFLLLNNPHINRMTVYFNGASEPAFQMGDQFPFQHRPYPDRDLVVPLSIAAKDSVQLLIHIEKKGETLQLKAEALPENAFTQRRDVDQMLMGFFTGWMALVFLFALFFWWELRQISALLYALLTGVLVIWLNTHWGVAFQYWWPNATWWVGKSRPFFNLLTNVLISLVILQIFKPRSADRAIKRWLYGLVWVQTGVMIATITISEYIVSIQAKMNFMYFTVLVSVAISVLLLAYLVRQWVARVPNAGFFLLGIAFVFVWNILLQLDQGIVPVGFTYVMYNFGTTFTHMVQTGLFTLGFAQIAARFRREKETLTITLLQKEKESAEALLAMQEAERHRIGRDLHDSIGGMLGSIFMQADILSRQHPEVPLDSLKELTTQGIEEARTLSHNLTPPHLEEWGLQKVLENQVALISKNNNIALDFFYEITAPLPQSINLIVYRICNELLSNIVKHSGATEAMLQIMQEETDLQIMAEDNGHGMTSPEGDGGLGMKSIRERIDYLHGEMHIDTNKEGTTIIIQLPHIFKQEA